MRTLLFPLLVVLITTVSHAQDRDGEPVPTWYYVTNGEDISEPFQASAVSIFSMDDMSEIFGDEKSLAEMAGTVDLLFAGIGEVPLHASSSTSTTSADTDSGGVEVTTKTDIGDDGSVVVTTTTKRKDPETGGTIETTTTTSSSPDGRTSSGTRTTRT